MLVRKPTLDDKILGSTLREIRARHSGPYAAAFAGKGKDRNWPWYVYGSAGFNVLGVLPTKEAATAIAEVMNS